MNKILVTLPFAALIFMGASCTQNTNAEMMEKNTNESMTEEDAMEKEGEDVMEKDEDAEAMQKTPGSYVAYDASAIAAAAKEGSAVLFFNASWCPTCKALNSDIKASLSEIPFGVTIFSVDYDTSSELKQKYGITYQHTLVQVDSEGTMITKWSGGNTLETVLSHIQ